MRIPPAVVSPPFQTGEIEWFERGARTIGPSFGNPAIRTAWPVALRPSLATGLPLSRRRLVANRSADFAKHVPGSGVQRDRMLSMSWRLLRQRMANLRNLSHGAAFRSRQNFRIFVRSGSIECTDKAVGRRV